MEFFPQFLARHVADTRLLEDIWKVIFLTLEFLTSPPPAPNSRVP